MWEILGGIDSGISLAKQLYELINDFKEAPENARAHLLNSQLSSIRLDLLRSIAQRAEFKIKLRKDHKEAQVAAAVRALNADLQHAKECLENKAPNAVTSRILWATWTGRGVGKLFSDIESRFSVLQSLFELVHWVPSLASLDKQDFTILSHYPEYKYLLSTAMTQYCVRADLVAPDNSNLRGNRTEINVLVESFRPTSEPENTSNEKQYKDARKLGKEVAERLWWTRADGNAAEVPYRTGVLPCIGHDEFRVVFLLPSNLEKMLKDLEPQTLTECIMSSPRVVVSLETRFSLALQLAEAVYNIHLAGLAHRSIRSSLILFLRPGQETNAGDLRRAPPSQPQSRNPNEEPPTGALRRLSRRLTGKKDKEASKVADKAPKRTPSMTSMAKGEKPRPLERVRSMIRLRRGASGGDNDVDRTDKATDDQGQHGGNFSPSGDSKITPRPGKIPPGFGSLYLTGWSRSNQCGRIQSPPTPRRTRDIYMHHTLQEKTAFYMGHDIYSLGVCLVEIGMWGVFAYKDKSTRREEFGPLASLADVQSSGVDLETVKNRIGDFASRELPAAMGEGFAELVKTCLTCLDAGGAWGGVGPDKFCERFRKDVLLPLRSIVAGFSSWHSETTASGMQ